MSFQYYSSNGVSDSSMSTFGHSIDSMFQCLWDCSQGLHCNDLIRSYDVSAHLREVHGIHGPDKSPVTCRWQSCNRGLEKETLARHIEEIHVGIVYRCQCGDTFSRKDTLNKHKTKLQH
ncbi:uncharacterized protein EDB93DRAFT_513224 [Suillus bovinus]|uniref:uncharacterized protein n=1 Tax=Suillus bovinus TaxID=48563 RepID=UPI001B8741F6|nr:uncharacterized protein EDB93DRAFT_513224 [Suillus bovinus]KAG2145309.1 hypothetical protein EDB93DRAFT_513224 [Suillus bovinus]